MFGAPLLHPAPTRMMEVLPLAGNAKNTGPWLPSSQFTGKVEIPRQEKQAPEIRRSDVFKEMKLMEWNWEPRIPEATTPT